VLRDASGGLRQSATRDSRQSETARALSFRFQKANPSGSRNTEAEALFRCPWQPGRLGGALTNLVHLGHEQWFHKAVNKLHGSLCAPREQAQPD
jgi:hypothetical protein